MSVFGYEKMFWGVWFLAKSSEAALPPISNMKVYLVSIFFFDFGKQIHYCFYYPLAENYYFVGCVVCASSINELWYENDHKWIRRMAENESANC